MIRNKYNNLKSICSVTPDPVSMTIPDQSLTIKQIFDRYQVNTAELIMLMRMRQAKKDGKEPSFEDITPDLDANQVYELRKRLAAKYKAPDVVNNGNSVNAHITSETEKLADTTKE